MNAIAYIFIILALTPQGHVNNFSMSKGFGTLSECLNIREVLLKEIRSKDVDFLYQASPCFGVNLSNMDVLGMSGDNRRQVRRELTAGRALIRATRGSVTQVLDFP